MAFLDDLAWFESNRAFIAGQYDGQWVLVKDQSVKGAYPSYEAAFAAGVAMFGRGPFVVKQATSVERQHKI